MMRLVTRRIGAVALSTAAITIEALGSGMIPLGHEILLSMDCRPGRLLFLLGVAGSDVGDAGSGGSYRAWSESCYRSGLDTRSSGHADGRHPVRGMARRRRLTRRPFSGAVSPRSIPAPAWGTQGGGAWLRRFFHYQTSSLRPMSPRALTPALNGGITIDACCFVQSEKDP